MIDFYIILHMNKLKFNLSEQILEKVKSMLREKKMTFAELAEKIGYTSTGLNRAFGKNNIKLGTLESISKEMGVDISYFFEGDVVERIADEIMKHEKNPDLRSFMFGFSRNIAKGDKLENAIGKILNPNHMIEQLM